MMLKHIQHVLNRKLKIKSDPPFATLATPIQSKTRGNAKLQYIPKLSEKLNSIQPSH